MVIDVITYNGEKELFEIRYNILKDYVDEFRVVEFTETFSGQPKAGLFPVNQYPNVKYYLIDKTFYAKYHDLAEESPNTKGAEHWKREFMQKESIKDCLTDLKDDDIVFLGDVDEIWDKEALKEVPHQKLKLKVYTYYLNNRSSELFWGTLYTTYGKIKNECLNHVRTLAICTLKDYGWHFTSLKDHLRQKLLDSYTEESYATPEVMARLEDNINNNRDFLGRSFTYRVDESEWPPWLKEHREDYKQLLKI